MCSLPPIRPKTPRVFEFFFAPTLQRPREFAWLRTTRTLVSSNRCGAEADKPTQKFGIEEQGKSDANVVVGNLCEGNQQGGIALVGPQTQVSGNLGSLVRHQRASK
jgi:hypothetical protein